jgi:hypothetical protein
MGAEVKQSMVYPSVFRKACWSSLCAIFIVTAGCTSERSVDARVISRADSEGPVWHELNLIVGEQRQSWATLAPGQEISMAFNPSPSIEPELTLLFRAPGSTAGAAQVWRGPRMTPGQGYRIRIEIGSDAKVTSRHCLKPCELD